MFHKEPKKSHLLISISTCHKQKDCYIVDIKFGY